MKNLFKLLLSPFYIIYFIFRGIIWGILLIPLAIIEGLAGKKYML